MSYAKILGQALVATGLAVAEGAKETLTNPLPFLQESPGANNSTSHKPWYKSDLAMYSYVGVPTLLFFGGILYGMYRCGKEHSAALRLARSKEMSQPAKDKDGDVIMSDSYSKLKH